MAYIKTVQELIDVLESLTPEQKQMEVFLDDDTGAQTIDYIEENDGPHDKRGISLQSENCSSCYPNRKVIWPYSDWEVE